MTTSNRSHWPSWEDVEHALRKGEGAGIRIAILDSGIEANHPGLTQLKLRDDIVFANENNQLIPQEGNRTDVFGHGTAIAGIIHQQAPQAELGSFRVLGYELESKTHLIALAAQLAIEKGYHIINCSFSCRIENCILQYKRWVDRAYLNNIHVVSACGDSGSPAYEWPSYLSSVLGVDACDFPARELNLFTQSHSQIQFASSASDLRVLWNEGGQKQVTGSSFATAHITSLLAKLLSIYPELGPDEAKILLKKVGVPIEQNSTDS